jgi:hypothetical protein
MNMRKLKVMVRIKDEKNKRSGLKRILTEEG